MKYTSIFILAFAFFASAQPIVKMQSHVQSYLRENSDRHRSGLFFAMDYGSNFEKFQERERIQIVSSENPSLLGKESFQEIKDISKSAEKSFLSVIHYENIAYFDSCKSTFKLNIDNLKKNQNQESKKLLKHLFSDTIAKQFDLFIIGTEYIESIAVPQTIENSYSEYINGKTISQTKTVPNAHTGTENGYTLFFQRIYKGRIVRGTSNYLTVVIDKDGRIKNMDMAWQDLFSTEKFTNISNNVTDITEALESVINSGYSYVIAAGDTLSIRSFDVNGVAKAWCKTATENALSPCLSYSVSVEASNGEIRHTVVDAPYSINYKKEEEFMGIAQSFINRK